MTAEPMPAAYAAGLRLLIDRAAPAVPLSPPLVARLACVGEDGRPRQRLLGRVNATRPPGTASRGRRSRPFKPDEIGRSRRDGRVARRPLGPRIPPPERSLTMPDERPAITLDATGGA